jgi:hypothetical protein
MAAKKKPAVSKQEQAQARRGGTQPSGRKWYLSAPDDRINSDGMPAKGKGSFRYLYTAPAGKQKPGSVTAPKGRATKAAGYTAESASYHSGSQARRTAAAKKAANPAPRIAKKQAERSGPTRAYIRVKKK